MKPSFIRHVFSSGSHVTHVRNRYEESRVRHVQRVLFLVFVFLVIHLETWCINDVVLSPSATALISRVDNHVLRVEITVICDVFPDFPQPTGPELISTITIAVVHIRISGGAGCRVREGGHTKIC